MALKNMVAGPESRSEFLQKMGSLEVIAGCMFSGKTDELVRRLEREEIRLKFLVKNGMIDELMKNEYIRVFKPSIDKRYSEDNIDSHRNTSFPAILIEKENPDVIFEHLTPNTKVVGIDEIQFFPNNIIQICQNLVNKGIRVIVSGLDTNFRGETFGPIGDLIAQARFADKLYAICVICGGEATRTQRIINGKPAFYEDPEVLIGAAEAYEARCLHHHEVPHRKEIKNG